MMRYRWLVGAALALLANPALAKPAAKSAPIATEGQYSQEPAAPDGYRYLIHVPRGYNASAPDRWPLIVFLHGSGERGTDVTIVANHGPPQQASMDPAFPFLIASPQAPAGAEWDVAKLDAMLDKVEKEWRVDRSRIYLTGLSRGGFGTWTWAMARPDRFAAIAPVAGWADPANACALKAMPIWAFHGDQDDVVPPEGSWDMVKAVRLCGGKPKLTVFPATNHNSWDQTYFDAELYLWLLKQRRTVK